MLTVDSVEPEPEGDASVRRFLDEATVGARLVEGAAYGLPAGGRLDAREGSERHQVLYVTAGRVTAHYRDGRHELTAGQGVYCEPGETCTLENDSDAPASFYRFLIVPS